jgi:hypothetical protein
LPANSKKETVNMANPTLAEIGAAFNDATTMLVGGVWNTANMGGNATPILNDLQTVQTGLQQQLQQDPGQFPGITAIHVQDIVNQLNLEIEAVKEVANGTGPGAPGSGLVFGAGFDVKAINDIQRDIIDIVQGDTHLQALATAGGANGFATLPDLLNAPTPFQDNAAQTAFVAQFVADSSSLGQQAIALVGSTNTAAINTLVQHIQTFENNASTFDAQQGGVFAARFANELDLNGNNGTIANDLIHGLQTGNANLVNDAAQALAANAADFSGNNHALGSPPSPTPVPPADQPADNFAEIGAIFNDATTMMVGGIWSGNKASVLADLKVTQSDLKELIDDHSDLFQGLTGIHADVIVHQLNLEIQAVKNVGVDPTAPKEVNDIQRDIIDIVQGDANLLSMATQGGANGFAPLPDLLHAPKPFQDSADQTAFINHFIAESNSLGQEALKLVGSDDDQAINALIHEIKADVRDAQNFTFAPAQAGVFAARFDNELAKQGTNGTVADALIQALKEEDVHLVQDAAGALAANAADFAGNNMPVGGGTYNLSQTLPVTTSHMHYEHMWG